MKNNLLLILSFFVLFSSCAFQRIGDLSIISNRNIDSSKEYVLIQRNAEATAKMRKDDALELAIDALTEKYKGEYLMNVKVFVKGNGKKIKVVGDVWGYKTVDVHVETSVNKVVSFNSGDSVTFHNGKKLTEGVIIGINNTTAVVEFMDVFGNPRKKEVPFDDLTKIEK